jgi:hypothetical protein
MRFVIGTVHNVNVIGSDKVNSVGLGISRVHSDESPLQLWVM